MGIVVVVCGVAACSDQRDFRPVRSTEVPVDPNDGQFDTPNGLPQGVTTNPAAPETGVIGVTHAAP